MSRRLERRRRRRRGEEIAAWIILPLIIGIVWVVGYQIVAEFKEPISVFLNSIEK